MISLFLDTDELLSARVQDFVLSEIEMMANLYPLESTVEGYVSFNETDSNTTAQHYDILGVDCEMVRNGTTSIYTE